MAKTKKDAAKKETTKKTAIKNTIKKVTAAPKKAETKAVKPVAKSTKKPEPKVKLAIVKIGKGEKAGKGDKKSAKIEVKAEIIATPGQDEEEEEESTPSQGGMSASGMAIAAAAAGSETSAGSLKNFRHHPDIENFYRFIFENDLRYEALEIIDVMATQREAIKQTRAARARPN